MQKGKVWLVGAGPSDVGLLTVKAKELIETADVVVYDRLIGQSITLMIPDSAEKIDAGKTAGNHTLRQEQTNQILLEKALEGKRVVRLKGGDPFLFGRGGEELELLVKHGVPFEVVPGVTSAIAVPAYNGIPATHRDATSSLHIITGHKRTGVALDVDFDALVRTKGTLVFLMGLSVLPEICQGLLDAGMSPDMPAAVLQQGASANQRKVVATITTLPDEAVRQGIKTPAIIVVGKVCAYHEEFAWYEHMPLFGQKILVTRPKDRASVLSEKLRKEGAQVLEVPAIKTIPITPNQELADAIAAIDTYQYLVFTSPAGVQYFMETMVAQGKDIRAFGNGKIAVIGQGSEKELRKYGIVADLKPEVYDGQHLGITIGEDAKDGDRILIPRASIGSRELIDEIKARKQVEICDLPTYDTVYEQTDLIDLAAEIDNGGITTAVFTSASTVKGFAEAAKGADFTKVRAACIGKQTAAAAGELGMEIFVAERATIDDLVELVKSM